MNKLIEYLEHIWIRKIRYTHSPSWRFMLTRYESRKVREEIEKGFEE